MELLEKHVEETLQKEDGQDVYNSDIDVKEIDENFWEELDNRHG